jgi:hypothetical protein
MNARFLLLTVSFGLGLTALPLFPLQAAIVTYDFQVNLTPPNTSYPNPSLGFLSYDDSLLAGIGEESISLTAFSFTFGASTYTLSNDPAATADFFNGDFLGANFAVSSSPQPTFISGLVPGAFSQTIDDAFFAYNTGANSGTGDIAYSLRTTPVGIPEPATTVGLLSLGLLALVSKIQQHHD